MFFSSLNSRALLGQVPLDRYHRSLKWVGRHMWKRVPLLASLGAWVWVQQRDHIILINNKHMNQLLNNRFLSSGGAIRSFSTSLTRHRHPKTESFLYWKGLDWDRITHFNYYAVIDPVDPREVLYLTEREYKQLVRVALSTETSILVIAHPGQERPLDWDEKASDKLSKISPQTYSDLSQKKFWRSAISRIEGFSSDTSTVRVSLGKLDPIIRRFGLLVASYSGVKVSYGYDASLRNFSHYSRHILSHQGINRYILWLKTTSFCLQSYLAGTPADTRALGCPMKLSKAGIPLWLPLPVRQAFRARHTGWIRAWLSLCNMYKALEGEYSDPSFDTIVGEPFIPDTSSFRIFLSSFTLVNQWKNKFSIDSLKPKKFPLLVTGSGVRPRQSILAADFAARRWALEPNNHLLNYLEYLQDERGIEVFKETLRHTIPLYKAAIDDHRAGRLFLGQLQLKYEAAGKIRVFAMVDYWTQYALSPLHLTLCKMLESFGESDATFDQEAAVDSFRMKGHKEFYSFDLKAATDNIPQALYLVVLGEIFGSNFSRLWMSLLVERDFALPYKDPKKKEFYLHNDKHYIRYTRGQPMGALSSWASMALVHHLIVQYAHFRICPLDADQVFTDYRVLGDDIVIANESVAMEYLAVCKEFGIPIGMAKSLISPRTNKIGRESQRAFSFASQIVVGSDNVSPISLKEELSASSMDSRLELVFRLLRRGWCNPSSNKLTFVIARLVPRLWARGHHLMKAGTVPPFIKALLPLLLSPASRDVGLTGFHKYYAWYQVLLGSYNFADLFNHKSWKEELAPQTKEFVEFLSSEARKIYTDLLSQQSAFEVLENPKIPLRFVNEPPVWYKYYLESLDRLGPYHPALETEWNPGVNGPWCLPLAEDGDVDLKHFQGWNAFDQHVTYDEPVDTRGWPSDYFEKKKKAPGFRFDPARKQLFRIRTLRVLSFNFPVVREAIKDYISQIQQLITPLMKPRLSPHADVEYRSALRLAMGLQLPFDLAMAAMDQEEERKPKIPTESQRLFHHSQRLAYTVDKSFKNRGIFALLTNAEMNSVTRNKLRFRKEKIDYQPWDGLVGLESTTVNDVHSLSHTYTRLEMLLTLQKVYSRLKPVQLLERGLSVTRKAGFSGFMRSIINIIKQTHNQLPSHYFVKREEIIPILPGV